MKANRYTTYTELCAEQKENEKVLKNLAVALDEAVTNDNWNLIDQLEAVFQAQIEKLSTIVQKLQYLESG
jgi:hypothetical protein